MSRFQAFRATAVFGLGHGGSQTRDRLSLGLRSGVGGRLLNGGGALGVGEGGEFFGRERQLLRDLGIGPGDRLAVSREGNKLVLRARPKDWVQYHGGSLAGVYGRTAAEVAAYLDELREDAKRDE